MRGDAIEKRERDCVVDFVACSQSLAQLTSQFSSKLQPQLQAMIQSCSPKFPLMIANIDKIGLKHHF